jgi:hypothetical protein
MFVVPGKKIVAAFTGDTSAGKPRHPIKLLGAHPQMVDGTIACPIRK